MSESVETKDLSRGPTVLERAISRAQSGEASIQSLLWALVASEIVFVNETVPQADRFPDQPMLLTRDGVTSLALFSESSFAAPYLTGDRVVVRGPALEVLRRLPRTAGIMMNAGARLGFEVPPDGIRAFVLDVLEAPVTLA